MTFHARPELANNIEGHVGPHVDAKRNGAISCARRAPRLPFAGNEGCSSCATDVRKRECPVPVVVAREQSARDRIFGSAEEPGLTRNKVPVVLVQCSRCTILQRPANYVLRKSASDALPIRLRSAAPFLRSVIRRGDSGRRSCAQNTSGTRNPTS